jgi:uncharacterized protein (TIGR02646 family)
MIHIKRGPAPSALKSKPVQEKLKSAARFFGIPLEKRRQRRYNFHAAILIPGVRKALEMSFKGKCGYCEMPVEGSTGYEIDSFRPRSRAVNLDGTLLSDYYWWLVYEWDNLIFSCPTCNKLKGSRFPIEGTRVPIGEKSEEKLLEERPLLLDPCRDFPEEELIFDEKGKVASDINRGRVTIDVLGLNRSTLVEARAAEFKLLHLEWKNLLSAEEHPDKKSRSLFSSLIHSSRPFLAMRRQFIGQWSDVTMRHSPEMETLLKPTLSFRTAFTRQAQEAYLKFAPALSTKKKATRKSVRKVAAASSRQIKSFLKKTVEDYANYEAQTESFSVASGRNKESYFTKTRLIERIEIKNFKILENVVISIPTETSADKGSWLLLLGENGSGKSSVLQAVALALVGKQHRSKLKLNPSSFVRHGCESGYVKVYLTGSPEPVELHFKKGSRLFTGKPDDPKALLLGYGATRLLPRNGSGTATKQPDPASKVEATRAFNLFNPFTPLNDATPWLWKLEEAEFDRIARSLKDLMLLKSKDRLIRNPRNKKRIEVEAFGTLVMLEDLSDGYQSIVALTTDIMSVMRLRWPAMEIAEGIVLIDEIDAHLHPSWKMKIIQRLRTVFPRLQFLVTSHDPLTLRGLHAGEVIVMKSDHRNRPVVITDLPSPEGMRVDQLLTSEYFGLNSTIDPATEEKFAEYYHLLALRKLTKAQEERLVTLKDEMGKLELLGATPREQLMLQATDEFLAKAAAAPRPADRPTLKDKTRKKIMNMWKKL